MVLIEYFIFNVTRNRYFLMLINNNLRFLGFAQMRVKDLERRETAGRRRKFEFVALVVRKYFYEADRIN